jgi:hypothetical protein
MSKSNRILTDDQVRYLRDQHDKYQIAREKQYHWKESAKALGIHLSKKATILDAIYYHRYQDVI